MRKRSYMRDHSINGVPLLMPDVNVEITYEDLEAPDSGYDESGFYHRQVIKGNKRTWKLKYAVLTEEEFEYLRDLVSRKKDFVFEFVNEKHCCESVWAYAKPTSVVYQSKRSGLYKNHTLEICEC